MPRKDVEPLQIHVPAGTRNVIVDYAESKGLNVSEYVRRLIEADMRGKDKPNISLKVTRPGNRRGKAEAGE